MDVTIHGRNVQVTPRLESYIERKVQRLDRYLPDIQEVRVDLAVDTGVRGADQKKAQITVRHARGSILRAEEVSDDLTGSVDTAVDRMYRRIEKYKGKRRTREPETTFDGYETAVTLPDEDMESGKVVRRKMFAVIPMNEEEAIEQLEMLGHDFFVFLNGDTGVVNVLYRRKDGDFGVIVPEW